MSYVFPHSTYEARTCERTSIQPGSYRTISSTAHQLLLTLLLAQLRSLPDLRFSRLTLAGNPQIKRYWLFPVSLLDRILRSGPGRSREQSKCHEISLTDERVAWFEIADRRVVESRIERWGFTRRTKKERKRRLKRVLESASAS